MKKAIIGFAAFAALAATGVSAMSLADASAKVGEAAKDPKTMSQVVKQLNKDDQVAFLAKVNAAIDGLNAPLADKTKLYVEAATAAMDAVSPENRAAMLAEIYATSSLESLTILNETLGGKVADGANPDAVKKVATDTMKIIQARNAGDGNEGVRDAFAALMFVRSSNGKPADLRETLISGLPENSRELARDEWFPAALGEGKAKSYEPMLAAGDGAQKPDLGDGWVAPSLVADASIYGMLSSDLATAPGGGTSASFSDMVLDDTTYALPMRMNSDPLTRQPRSASASDPWSGQYRRGSGFKGSETAKKQESEGYSVQTTF